MTEQANGRRPWILWVVFILSNLMWGILPLTTFVVAIGFFDISSEWNQRPVAIVYVLIVSTVFTVASVGLLRLEPWGHLTVVVFMLLSLVDYFIVRTFEPERLPATAVAVFSFLVLMSRNIRDAIYPHGEREAPRRGGETVSLVISAVGVIVGILQLFVAILQLAATS